MLIITFESDEQAYWKRLQSIFFSTCHMIVWTRIFFSHQNWEPGYRNWRSIFLPYSSGRWRQGSFMFHPWCTEETLSQGFFLKLLHRHCFNSRCIYYKLLKKLKQRKNCYIINWTFSNLFLSSLCLLSDQVNFLKFSD